MGKCIDKVNIKLIRRKEQNEYENKEKPSCFGPMKLIYSVLFSLVSNVNIDIKQLSHISYFQVILLSVLFLHENWNPSVIKNICEMKK